MEDLEGFKKKIESDIKRYETESVILLPFLDEAKGYIVEELCNKYKVIYYKNGGIINSSKNRYLLTQYDYDDSYFKIKKYQIIYNKKYYEIKHKNVLGSLMSLGIKRETIGDIIINDNNDIYFSCTEEISKFLEEEFNYCGNTPISLKEIDYDITNNIKFIEKDLFVSSLRLDCVLSSVYNISRSKILEEIMNSNVFVNYVSNLNPSHNLKLDDIINLRHKGKFKIGEINGTSRSGRIHIKVLIWS